METKRTNLLGEEIITCNDCGADITSDSQTVINNKDYCKECAEDYSECACCEEVFHNYNMTTTDDGLVCDDCLDGQYFWCECCEEYYDYDNSTDIEGEMWCENCVDNYATRCNDCGEYVQNDNAHEVSGYNYVCDSCYDDYNECYECGGMFHSDETRWINDECYCDDCADDVEDSSAIGSYHSMSSSQFEFYGDDENNSVPYLGAEIEIDADSRREYGENNRVATEIKQAMPDNFIYMENDGSLNYGFENITHPATLEYHEEIKDNYKKMFRICTSNGYRAHQTTTCGLHVHFNRDFFEDDSDECITRLLYLNEKFWDELTKFSRRKMNNLERWAKKYNKEPIEIVEDMKKRNLDRYHAINLTNSNTIEFRMFRGTLKLNTYIATLQLVNNLVMTAKYMTKPEELQSLKWEDFITTTELKAYWEEVKDRVVR